ncbi:MAG: apolipoprotein N-acyltransferase [Acidimicrobiia bacterium]|nr:apolipoprotein N-acyltransferase [Acidimicrobiia bacterium]
MTQRVAPILLSAVAGVALSLAFPLRGWWWITIPAIALFLLQTRRPQTIPSGVLAGFAFGVSFFGFLMPWLGELGLIALVPPVVVLSIWPALYGGFMARAADLPVSRWFIRAVGGWALMEWIRVRWPLGGLEWGLPGYSLSEWAPARGSARWIGASGWTVMVVAAAAVVVLLATRDSRRAASFRLAAGVAGLLVLLLVSGALWPPHVEGEVVRVAVVQGNNPCPGKHCANERYQTYQNHLRITRTLEPGSVHLVIWPEGSTGSWTADPINAPEVGEAMGAEAARIGAVLLAGGDRPLNDTDWANANVVFDQTGEIVSEYHKQHPVPYGEYIPARSWFKWVENLHADLPSRDMVRGDGPVLWDLGFGTFGSVISFEGSFARYGRENAREGAGLLILATSQESYPYSVASDQFIGITRMRAAELGMPLIHTAVTGRSTLITPTGLTGPRTALAEEALLVGEVQTRSAEQGPTLYVRLGDWLQLVAIVLLVGEIVQSRFRRRYPSRHR